MPNIPLPPGLEGSENLPHTFRTLKNCFNNGTGRIIGRPGIASLSSPGGAARGGFKWNDALYQVYSTSLLKMTVVNGVVTGATTSIGTISGSAPIKSAIGFNTAMIVVPGSTTYTLDKSDTLVDVTGNANFVAFDDIAHMNGRFILIPTSGDPAKFTDVGAGGTIGALSFFDAEALPDNNRAVYNGKDTLFILGENSIEPFRDIGSTTNPYIRISGGRILNGHIGGLLEYNNTHLFVGREENQDRGIYGVAPGGALKISNERVELILKKYSIDELSNTIATRVKFNGNDLAFFRFPRDSVGYYAGNWFLVSTVVDDVEQAWNAGFVTQFQGTYFSAFAGKFGKFERVNTDHGDPVEYNIDVGFPHPDSERFSIGSAELRMSQGFNTADGSIGLRMSRDNVLYGATVFRNLGAAGQYNHRLRWNLPGGLGSYEGFAGMRFQTRDDINFSVETLSVDTR